MVRIFLLLSLFSVCFAASKRQEKLVTFERVPKSCLDHLRLGRKESGYYEILQDRTSSNVTTVYCDMTSEPGSVWTLIMSYQLKQIHHVAFSITPFSVDKPVNGKTPNWYSYRMTLDDMKALQSHTTHWRSTCDFQHYGVDYTDYLRGNFKVFDPITFLGNVKCKRVEYVNIRGHMCTDCTAKFWQSYNRYGLHIDSSGRGCDLDATSGSIPSENNFGFYLDGANEHFRCATTQDSTTNWWFGEYI